MEDCATTFFINGLKVHIESSINKYDENLSIIFEQDFDNLFLNPIFINNLNLFRELIYQNNLNFQIFWNHIGRIMNSSIASIIIKFEEGIKKEKEDNNLKKELGNKNILKLKILKICFFFITNEEPFELIKEDDKQKLKNLLEIYIKKEIENQNDFTLFIQNYIIKISLLINDNNRNINISFLKFLSFTFYNFETESFKNNKHMNQLKIYIDQVINNPRRELNNYLNAAFNKKSYKKERISRSRGASFDIKEINGNINVEKNNKKIDEFFKRNNIDEKNENSGGTKEAENKENDNKENYSSNNFDNKLKNQKSKINNSSTQGKYFHYSSHASNLSLINFNSGLSNISNSYGLNNSFSFSKNINNSRLSLDDSFSLTGIFSTPISDLNENDNNDSKKFTTKFPTIIKCVENKGTKTFDKFFNSQMNIKKNMKIDNNKKENDDLKELKKIINSSNFYGNGYNYNVKNNVNKKNKEKNENKNLKKKDKDENKNKVNKGKNKDILIYKTPNKNEKTNQENKNENMDMNGLKKNWELLFAQKPSI